MANLWNQELNIGSSVTDVVLPAPGASRVVFSLSGTDGRPVRVAIGYGAEPPTPAAPGTPSEEPNEVMVGAIEPVSTRVTGSSSTVPGSPEQKVTHLKLISSATGQNWIAVQAFR